MLLLIALCAPGVTHAQMTLTVNDGTTTNGQVPIYGYWADNVTRSQFVIPASDLEDMAGGDISQMTFYCSSNYISWGNGEWKVYLTEVDNASVSSLYTWTSMSEVYEGSLSVSNNQMQVAFSSNYTYGGGNLLVGFYQTTNGSYVSSSWYGIYSSGMSMGGYGSSVNSQSFSPLNSTNKRNRVDQADHVCIVCKYTTNF